jgi:sugar phosphate isomerase/epimerase
MNKLPVAIQVYSVREVAEKDLKQTLQEIKNMGYDGVELAGLYGHTPEEVRDYLKEIGLVPISAHVPYSEFI